MKKLICLMLCISILMLQSVLFAEAIPLNSTRDELNAQFLDGEIRTMDYVYFSPVKNNDTTKYPVMVWLHGNASGKEPRGQIKYRGFSNWASDEFQARFKNAGGCILFAPRANSIDHSWSGVTVAELKGVIDTFLKQYKDNVDYSRIYVGGYSVGADMTWNMLLAYPQFFAAGVPCSAISPPSEKAVARLTDTSLWTFNCDIDFWLGARTSNMRPVFKAMSEASNRKSGLRMTSLSQTVLANGEKQGSYQEEHYTWEAVTYDMHMADHVTPYAYSTTVDGTGSIITFENPEIGVIDWLSKQTNDREDNTVDDMTFGFMNVIRRIIAFFTEFFKSFLK